MLAKLAISALAACTFASAAPAGLSEPDFVTGSAWYLGPDGINATGAWALGLTGLGVNIVFNDDGLDYEHVEFEGKYNSAGSCKDPLPFNYSTEQHGTVCAGLAAAAVNGECSVGVAPGATVSACDIYHDIGYDDDASADMMEYGLGVNDVSSNSWGIDSCA